MLEEGCDRKQRRRNFEAEQIERELREIRVMIETRQKNREMIINRRLEDLIGSPDMFEW